MTKDLSDAEIHSAVEHAIKLQQDLIAVQNAIDGHKSLKKTWSMHVMKECDWLEKNYPVTLGSWLSAALERINTINREGGPAQGNIQLIADATLAITKFIGSHLANHKKKAA